MSIEAMKLALEALESVTGHFTRTPSTLRDSEVRGEAHNAITALRQAIEQAEKQDELGYATRLATAIWKSHYKEVSPDWKPFDSLAGVLTQIDNMASGLTKQAKKQEPVAWMPIDSAPKGRIILVHYKNLLGNGRTMRARYYLPDTLDSDSTESGWADEGWYEESEAYEYLMPLEYEPTHWMPLPAAPDTQLTHTAPPKREWVGLTDEDKQEAFDETQEASGGFWEFADYLEAKLKEKNGG